ncbi:phosphoprotein [Carpione rhabdovirus]|nr:phosphoprotein [Carpione rhabdovirus]
MDDIEMSESLVTKTSDLTLLGERLNHPLDDNPSSILKSDKQEKHAGKKVSKTPGNMDPIEAFILEFVPEDQQQAANKKLRRHLAQVKADHKEELTKHLEKVNAESRANLKAVVESQKENNKTTQTILATLISMREKMVDNDSKKPRPLDKDQIRSERALGFERGYGVAAAVIHQLKIENPSLICKNSIRGTALEIMEKHEFEASAEAIKMTIKFVKSALK